MKFPDRRRTLRQRTGTAHTSLEAQVGPLTNKRAYTHYCRGLQAFRSAAEPALQAFVNPDIFGEWQPAAVAAELSADLSDLGARAISPPEIVYSSSDEAIGGFYVLEGSALGARVLIQGAQALGMSAEHGARHLALQSATLNNWRGFLDLLESMPHLDIEAAVLGANRTFAAATDAMARAHQND